MFYVLSDNIVKGIGINIHSINTYNKSFSPTVNLSWPL